MQQQILDDLKQAMLSRDTVTTTVLKSLKVALQYESIEKNGKLEESDEIRIVKREAKKRREAIDIYSKAGQTDKADAEEAELTIIQNYLPQQLSEKEMIKEVEGAVEKLGANQASETGKVMGYLSKKLAGQVDNKRLSEIVRDRLKG